jgi:hypothetical protein
MIFYFKFPYKCGQNTGQIISTSLLQKLGRLFELCFKIWFPLGAVLSELNRPHPLPPSTPSYIAPFLSNKRTLPILQLAFFDLEWGREEQWLLYFPTMQFSEKGRRDHWLLHCSVMHRMETHLVIITCFRHAKKEWLHCHRPVNTTIAFCVALSCRTWGILVIALFCIAKMVGPLVIAVSFHTEPFNNWL